IAPSIAPRKVRPLFSGPFGFGEADGERIADCRHAGVVLHLVRGQFRATYAAGRPSPPCPGGAALPSSRRAGRPCRPPSRSRKGCHGQRKWVRRAIISATADGSSEASVTQSLGLSASMWCWPAGRRCLRGLEFLRRRDRRAVGYLPAPTAK